MYVKICFAVYFAALFYKAKCTSNTLPTCTKSDFHYEFTSCDSDGGRWRVSVPSPDTCVGGNPDPPVRGQDCDFTCEPGEYLDVDNDQECHSCPAGSYSLGGGVLYNDWNSLPLGFSSRIEPYSYDENNDDFQTSNSDCKQMGWQTKRHYIVTNNTECVSVLTYSAKLVRDGSVTFVYQFVSSPGASMLTFEVDNSDCQSMTDKPASMYLDTTENSKWRTITVDLKAGVSILYWRSYAVVSNSISTEVQKFIAIRSVNISGVAFTSDCTPCEAGTYMPTEGAESCLECPANTYSGSGATVCTKCDEEIEFSESGSASCSKKPSCTSDHYIAFYDQCIAGHTKKLYKWIEPRICRNGVSLPTDGPMVPCSACNVGMQLRNGTCHFCGPDEYSDGLSVCKKCPGSTASQTGVVYKRWDNLPRNANITTQCMSLRGPGSSMGCIAHDGWIMNSDFMQTVSMNADDVFLVASLEIGGFHFSQHTVNDGSGESDTLTADNAELSFVFDTVCSDRSCEFLFFMQEHGKKTQLVQSWRGPLSRTAYKFPMMVSTGAKFSWAYRKSSTRNQFELENSYARIHLINVTNTLNGGAESCRPCPQGTSQDGCMPCSLGEYIDADSVQCTPCPVGTIVRSTAAWGIDSCVPCGPGLRPYKGHRCISDCMFTSTASSTYNFQQLAKLLTVRGPKLFTVTGDAYYHLLNISLCGNNGHYPLASCLSNMTSSNAKHKDNEVVVTPTVNAHVCQSTILLSKPSTDKAESVISVSPISLGARLVAVTDEADAATLKLMSDARFSRVHDANMNDSEDIYMLYASDIPTAACKQGRNVTVILRCTVTNNEDDGTVILPKECSDGTCDGCNFILMVRSQSACHLCTKNDFERFNTPCIESSMTSMLRMIKPCHDLNGEFDLTQRVESCSNYWQSQWPIGLKVVVILVPVLLVGGAVLLLAVVYCWVKNRSLEYKYSKLIESSSSADGNTTELSAVDTCALDEGEDEEEEFDVVKVRKGKKFFRKFKIGHGSSAGNKMDDDELFESMRMSDKSSMS